MKFRFFKSFVIVFTIVFSINLQAQFDDLYYDYHKDKVNASYASSNSSGRSVKNTDTQTKYSDDAQYDSDTYDNYDDYSYGTRLSRFQNSGMNNYYSSFNNWWNYDYYYNPYYSRCNSVNVFIGSPWNRWNMGNSWGWNSWNYGYGYNSWNNGWNNGWNNFGCNSFGGGYPGYGYNSWGNNIYYGNVYYGNGYNNNNGNYGNNGYDNSNKIYGSRKGGSLSSSIYGRNASPRREVSGGNQDRNNQTQAGLTKDNNGLPNSSSSTSRTERTFKGDIKDRQSSDVLSGNNSGNSERTRIFSSPERRKADDNQAARDNGNDRSNQSQGRTMSPDTRRPYDNRSTSPSDNRRNSDPGMQQSRRNYDNNSSPGYDNGSSRRNNDSGFSRGNGWDSGSSGRGNSGGGMGSGHSSGGGGGGFGGSSRGGGGSRRGG